MKTLVQILESLDEYYHFTHTYNLKHILEKDSWLCSEEDSYGRDDYKYYVSLTRSKNASTGYPAGLDQEDLIRIVFNGKALNSKFKIEPVSFDPGAKTFITRAAKNNPEAYKKYGAEWKKQVNVEAEDRLYSKLPEIKGISKYIKRIDLCEEIDSDMDEIIKLCDKLGVTYKVYPSIKYFNLGK